MTDWFGGIYLKAMAAPSPGFRYERAAPHRHDFYYCVLLEAGSLEMEVDFAKVLLREPSLFLSYPGQVHQIHAAAFKKGWFLAFDPAVIGEPLRDILDQFLSEVVLVQPTAAQAGRYNALLGQLSDIYHDPAQLFRHQTLPPLVTAFVYQLAGCYLSSEQAEQARHPARSVAIIKSFKQMLRRNYRSLKRPGDYANALHLTTGYLNDTVKAVTGFPVTDHIRQEVMREACRLLGYTDLAVKEVAAALGFDDVKYFTRLFSKATGQSPAGFCKRSAAQ